MKTSSALSWFGSDSEVAADLARFLDNCRHVTIPFVGGASIIPHLKARAIVANDLHSHAINFYRCLGGRYGHEARIDLICQCQHTLSHPEEIARARELLASGQLTDQAWAFWATCWIGRKGKGGTTEPAKLPSVRWNANGGTNASRIQAAANDLDAWATTFERCEWQEECFRMLLPKVKDQRDCGIYVDAPWRGAGDEYLHSFTDQDHRDLRNALGRFEQTTVVVRYGDDDFLRELYVGWEIIEASSRTQSNARTGEIWILNDAAAVPMNAEPNG